MVADVILGFTIDTSSWIERLKSNNSNHIIVLDYDYKGEVRHFNGITYISNIDIKEYIIKFDKVNFYKSLYGLPGMNGSTSTIYKKK